MKNRKFWKWTNLAPETGQAEEEAERVLELYGTISEESWLDDDVTPQMFKDELLAGSGPVTIWINSPGGDCVAASQIYSMLMDYKGSITVKIDGIAASAASVIAMAGTKVLMAPTSLLMIHNPMTMAFGDYNEMQKAISMLDEVKESIINAYEIKTGMSRAKLAHLMDSETWMNANKAIELGFADDILKDDKRSTADTAAYAFSGRAAEISLLNKLAKPVVHSNSVNKTTETVDKSKNAEPADVEPATDVVEDKPSVEETTPTVEAVQAPTVDKTASTEPVAEINVPSGTPVADLFKRLNLLK